MAQTLQFLTGGEPRAVQVSELEAELSALWRSAAGNAESREAVTRACALTLLVYVESEEAGREASNLVSTLTQQNPCRAVIMIAAPRESPPGRTAWISAICHLPVAGEKQVCCEQISVLARGEAVEDLDKIVLPLTVPGLPVYLWWRADHFSPSDHFNQVLRVSNRVLIDSARFPDADLGTLSARLTRPASQLSFSDLNWIRLTPWRELAAQCFDSRETRAYRDRLSDVQIMVARGAGQATPHWGQALLFVGWLAGRLRWERADQLAGQASPRENVRLSFFFRSSHGAVQAQIDLRQGAGDVTGNLVSVILKAGGDAPASFSLLRGPDGKCVLTRAEIPGRAPIERTCHLEVLEEIELVNEDLKFPGRDRIYEEALGLVAKMVPA